MNVFIKSAIILVLNTIIFLVVFRISCNLLGDSIHYFNYKIGAAPLYTIAGLDFVPIILFLDSILFLNILIVIRKRIKDKDLSMVLKINYYYLIIITIYFTYFLIISYLGFYGITNRLPFSLYSL
jgi:hypothetical protein